jgi:hypothetical protein
MTGIARVGRFLVLLSLGLTTPLLGSSAGPNLIDYQGVALDAAGQPINGSVAVIISIWRDPTSTAPADRIFSEQHPAVSVSDGVFSLQIGAGSVLQGLLDAQVFSEEARWLEVSINGEQLQPRQRFTSVAYSLSAERAGNGVPRGAVMFFALSSCPAGWSPYSAAEGRAIVGVPPGGTLLALIGPALGPQEDRVHSHGVDLLPLASTSSGGHAHTVDPPATISSASGASHTHTVDIASITSSTYSHRHDWAAYQATIDEWVSYDASGDVISIIDWADGMDTAGSGTAPLAVDLASPSVVYYTSEDQHSHTANPPPTVSTTGSADHAHDVDINAFASSSVAGHSHQVDPAATTSTPSGTSSVMPYIQLLVCWKN